MCLIAFAWRADARYPLVVAANRDEFYARPTAPAAWSADGRVLGGRDLRAGGTWMAVSREARFAALTNLRDPAAMRPDAPSRGALTDAFVGGRDGQERSTASGPAEAAIERIAATAGRYNGFNLLAAQWAGPTRGMWIVAGGATTSRSTVEPGFHALSNARLDTPWPKAVAARDALRTAVGGADGSDALIERLFALLADRGIADDARLPRTGVPLDTERALSAAFIRMPGYGTRASTVLVVEGDGRATFVERRCEPDVPAAESRFVFEVTGQGG